MVTEWFMAGNQHHTSKLAPFHKEWNRFNVSFLFQNLIEIISAVIDFKMPAETINFNDHCVKTAIS